MADVQEVLVGFIDKVKNDPGLSELVRDALHEMADAFNPPPEQPVEPAPVEPEQPVEPAPEPVEPQPEQPVEPPPAG
jgi:hypothetical protein